MNTEFNNIDMEMLTKRAMLYKELGNIQISTGLRSLSVLQYYAKHLGITSDKINQKAKTKLIALAREGEQHITKSIHTISQKFGIDKSGEEGFCSMVLAEGKLCDYFLDHKTQDIIDKIATYDTGDKIYSFVEDIYPEFDFDKFFRDYTY